MENACIDLFDERDYKYSDLLWAWILPEKPINAPKITILNQSLKSITRMACTRYWIIHIINMQRVLNWETEVDWLAFWQRYLEINPFAEEMGASLQSALNQAKNEKLIWWYFIVNTEEEINDALYRWYFIYTGSNNGDWTNVANNHEYKLRTDWKLVWHAWALPKENQGLNSYWEDNWYFEISKDLYNTTYTKYAILPAKDYNLIDKYKQMIRDKIWNEVAKIAFDLWLYNWINWPIDRETTAIIVLRAIQKLQEWKLPNLTELLDNIK